ncbi:MAG: hypothetical protein WDM80_17105 [Limisphaerales bacterium]
METGVLADADFNGSGKHVAILSHAGTIQIMEVKSGQMLANHAATQPASRQIRLSPDGSHIAVIGGDNRLEWRDALTGAIEQAWLCPETILNAVCGEDNDTVMIQGDTAAYLWSARRERIGRRTISAPRRRLAD